MLHNSKSSLAWPLNVKAVQFFEIQLTTYLETQCNTEIKSRTLFIRQQFMQLCNFFLLHSQAILTSLLLTNLSEILTSHYFLTSTTFRFIRQSLHIRNSAFLLNLLRDHTYHLHLPDCDQYRSQTLWKSRVHVCLNVISILRGSV